MAKNTPDSITEYKRLMAEISSGKIKPVNFLAGMESFLIDRLQDAFTKLIPPEVKDFNYDLLYGQDTNPDQVLDIARSFPMMSDKRMLIVREFTKLFESDDEDDTEKSSADGLINYLNHPNESCYVIFIGDKAPPANTKLGKAFKKNDNASICYLESVKDSQLPGWISAWIKSEHKMTIDQQASQMLAYAVGADLQKLSSEIDKLCTYKNTQEEITSEDVKKMVGVSREFSVFELQDALISKNLDQALNITEQMLHQSDSETGEVIKTTGYLYSVFSKVWQIQQLGSKGLTPKQISAKVGAYGFYYEKLNSVARAYSPQKLPEIFEILLDADRAVKGFGKMDPSSIMMMTVKKIIL